MTEAVQSQERELIRKGVGTVFVRTVLAVKSREYEARKSQFAETIVAPASRTVRIKEKRFFVMGFVPF